MALSRARNTCGRCSRRSAVGTTVAREIQVTASLLIVSADLLLAVPGLSGRQGSEPADLGLGRHPVGRQLACLASQVQLADRQLYITYGVISGFGTGIIYVDNGLMVRWVPRPARPHRLEASTDLASASSSPLPIDSMIKSVRGYQYALLVWGIVLGAVGVVRRAGSAHARPCRDIGRRATRSVQIEMQSKPGYTPIERCSAIRSSICCSS